ncbi:MAG TPA: class I SAM-dependent methyltransferase, partial [Acidobacteriota bacterium]|nr:class I SAM-dependent methyltransferase [Acidobacteriota bacterium]
MNEGQSGFYLRAYSRLPDFLKRRINPLEYAIEDFIKAAAQDSPGRVVLDAGAGEARFARHFRNQFYLAIDSCVGDSTWDYSRVQVVADLSALPLAAATVDTVLNVQVLEHVRNPLLVLSEIYRVLTHGGRLYLTAPQGWCEHQQPHDFYRFTRFALQDLLSSAGFSEIEIRPFGGYFHYLGHRLTFIPKILFPRLPWIARVLLFPFELASLALFCLVLPIACYYLDRLDPNPEFTLGYRCVARKLSTTEKGREKEKDRKD